MKQHKREAIEGGAPLVLLIGTASAVQARATMGASKIHAGGKGGQGLEGERRKEEEGRGKLMDVVQTKRDD